MKKKMMLDRNMNFYKGMKNNGNGKYVGTCKKIFYLLKPL